jgi:hypothetical protein
MNLLHETPYFKIFHDPQNALFESSWLDADKVTPDIFKQEMLAYVELVNTYQPQYYLTDSTFTISVELQDWVTEHVFPYTMHATVKKFALITPSDFIAQVSLEQTIDTGEKYIGAIPIQYFNNRQDALQWLLKDKK